MILKKYLKKLGVSSVNELSPEELRTYRQWENALSGRELTSEDVAKFLDMQIEDCLSKLVGQSLSDREDVFLKMQIDLIRKIKVFLNAPAMEAKAMQQALESQT